MFKIELRITLVVNSLGEILHILRSQKSKLFSKYDIRTLAIFGSFVKGQSNKQSDIDILVEFENPKGIEFIDLANELEEI